MRLLSNNPRIGLGGRLQDLLASRFALQSVPDRPVRGGELTPALQRCLARLASDCVWRAYRSSPGVCCAIARAPAGAGGASGEELEVYFIDANAWVYSAALWVHDSAHGWWLNSALAPSYDCEHGWWLGALLAPQVEPTIESTRATQEFLALARPAPQEARAGRAR